MFKCGLCRVYSRDSLMRRKKRAFISPAPPLDLAAEVDARLLGRIKSSQCGCKLGREHGGILGSIAVTAQTAK